MKRTKRTGPTRCLVDYDPKRGVDGVEFGTAAVMAYIQAKGDPPDTKIDDLTDLLTDLRHYASAHGIDFGRCVDISEMHWEAERLGGQPV